MAQLLNQNNVRFVDSKSFLTDQAGRLKSHAQELANHAGRPFEYLTSHTRMQQRAHELAERDNLNAGLVCVFSVLEPCRTFSFQFTQGRPFVNPARRKCLFL